MIAKKSQYCNLPWPESRGLYTMQSVKQLSFGVLASRRPLPMSAVELISHNLKLTIRSVCSLPGLDYVVLEPNTANHAKRTFR